jgi:hypothetical protein
MTQHLLFQILNQKPLLNLLTMIKKMMMKNHYQIQSQIQILHHQLTLTQNLNKSSPKPIHLMLQVKQQVPPLTVLQTVCF